MSDRAPVPECDSAEVWLEQRTRGAAAAAPPLVRGCRHLETLSALLGQHDARMLLGKDLPLLVRSVVDEGVDPTALAELLRSEEGIARQLGSFQAGAWWFGAQLEGLRRRAAQREVEELHRRCERLTEEIAEARTALPIVEDRGALLIRELAADVAARRRALATSQCDGRGRNAWWRLKERLQLHVDTVVLGAELEHRSWIGELQDIVGTAGSAALFVCLGVLLHVEGIRGWVLGFLLLGGLGAIASRIRWGRQEAPLLAWVRATTTAAAVWGLLQGLLLLVRDGAAGA